MKGHRGYGRSSYVTNWFSDQNPPVQLPASLPVVSGDFCTPFDQVCPTSYGAETKMPRQPRVKRYQYMDSASYFYEQIGVIIRDFAKR